MDLLIKMNIIYPLCTKAFVIFQIGLLGCKLEQHSLVSSWDLETDLDWSVYKAFYFIYFSCKGEIVPLFNNFSKILDKYWLHQWIFI